MNARTKWVAKGSGIRVGQAGSRIGPREEAWDMVYGKGKDAGNDPVTEDATQVYKRSPISEVAKGRMLFEDVRDR